jgi:hypothetical protein
VTHSATTDPTGTTEVKTKVKKNVPKKKAAPKTSKNWKCNECEFIYISPIPVLAVEHKCKTAPIPGVTRKGMLPQD